MPDLEDPPRLDPVFIQDLHARIEARTLEVAAAYFREGNTAYTQHPGLRRVEMARQFFDLQPCCVSVLARPAARGDARAMMLVARIFENTEYFLDEWRSREGHRFCLTNAQVHLALAYERLRSRVSGTAALRWRALLLRSVKDLLVYCARFRERDPQPGTVAIPEGLDGVVQSAEGVWRTGHAAGRPDLCALAGEFVARLIRTLDADGSPEERLAAQPLPAALTGGAAYGVQRWRGRVDRDWFIRRGRLVRRWSGAGTPPAFGLALHSLEPEGRGYLREALSADSPLLQSADLGILSRVFLESEAFETET
jgi:hypothetical protein